MLSNLFARCVRFLLGFDFFNNRVTTFGFYFGVTPWPRKSWPRIPWPRIPWPHKFRIACQNLNGQNLDRFWQGSGVEREVWATIRSLDFPTCGRCPPFFLLHPIWHHSRQSHLRSKFQRWTCVSGSRRDSRRSMNFSTPLTAERMDGWKVRTIGENGRNSYKCWKKLGR